MAAFKSKLFRFSNCRYILNCAIWFNFKRVKVLHFLETKGSGWTFIGREIKSN